MREGFRRSSCRSSGRGHDVQRQDACDARSFMRKGSHANSVCRWRRPFANVGTDAQGRQTPAQARPSPRRWEARHCDNVQRARRPVLVCQHDGVFPADQETVNVIPAAATNVWWIDLVPGEYFTYNLRRLGSERYFSIRFDLKSTVKAPAAPWGWKD